LINTLLYYRSNIGTTMSSDWKTIKGELAEMSREDRRKRGYHCGEKFVQLQSVPTWKDYFLDKEDALKEKRQDDKKEYEVNEDLNTKISIWRGDITTLEIDCIVNAANESLLGGGGVDGAIHRSAGEHLLDECRTLEGCETGDAKITSGYELPSSNVIHTVGPRGIKPDLLKSCYEKSLTLMMENDKKSIAFPCISTGIYGYPSDEAAPVAIQTVRNFILKHSEKVDRIIFCLFLEKDVKIYETLLQTYFPVKED